ncbi:MAG: putative LPS assembly protein LptD [Vicinamibacterales bacterium]
MRPAFRLVLIVAVALCSVRTAAAQLSVNVAGFDIKADRQERLGEHHALLVGKVELERGDTKLYADEMEFFDDKDLVLARGNVVLTQANNRIASDTAEFNTKTSLGTFHHANGIATIAQPPRPSAQPGGLVIPQMSGQDNDVYFFGEIVEKQGTKKYKITNGGFSTCVQPTPRWDLTADTVVLNVDHYTLLRQAIFKVKGVPLLYLPAMYFPTQEDGRATGFLLPTYGHSTLRGNNVHVPFFWAINRSQDATLFYDYYSKTGGGGGAEYRYVGSGGSNGNVTALRLDDRATTYLPASTSYTVKGTAFQALPGRLMARAYVDYFSNLLTNQTYFTDLTTTSTNRSYYTTNVFGAWHSYSLNASFDRSEYFQGNTSLINGNSPKIALSRSERPIAQRSPVYFSIAGEILHFDRRTTVDGRVTDDKSLGRLDLFPQIRYPFKKWQWFTVNTTASWRETYYTRSQDEIPATDGTTTTVVVDDNLNRAYGTFSAQAVGPVFTRIWSTPDNHYAEKFKHTISPNISLQRTTAVANFARILPSDSVDYALGDTTSIAYGLSNRIYAKRKIGQSSQAQEIISLDAAQTYYSDARQSLTDTSYQTSTAGSVPSKFSPVRATLRVSPTTAVGGSLSAEVDSRSKRLKTMSANGFFNPSQTLQASLGWSRSFFIATLPGYDDQNTLNHSLNGTVNLRTRNNEYGLTNSFSLDIHRATLTQIQTQGFYNSQCCGLAVSYMRSNYSYSQAIPANNRFLLSFTLQGLGNFSPFSGAQSGGLR